MFTFHLPKIVSLHVFLTHFLTWQHIKHLTLIKNGPNPASFCLFSFFYHMAKTKIAKIGL